MKYGFSLAQRRRKPKAEAIAAAILENAGILSLRTPRIISDIRERFHVGMPAAIDALAIARDRA